MFKKHLKGSYEGLSLIVYVRIWIYFILYSIPRSSCEIVDNIENNGDAHNKNSYLLHDRNFTKLLVLFYKMCSFSNLTPFHFYYAVYSSVKIFSMRGISNFQLN
jgi:hypothetical protein